MSTIDYVSLAMIVLVIALVVVGISGHNIWSFIKEWLIPDNKIENDAWYDEAQNANGPEVNYEMTYDDLAEVLSE